jgi:hypothetical protein
MHLLSYGTVTIDEIRELISLVTGTGVAELEVQRGDNRVRIRLGAVAQDYTAQPGIPSRGWRASSRGG